MARLIFQCQSTLSESGWIEREMLGSTLWAMLTTSFKGIDIKGEGHEKKTVSEQAAARKTRQASEEDT